MTHLCLRLSNPFMAAAAFLSAFILPARPQPITDQPTPQHDTASVRIATTPQKDSIGPDTMRSVPKQLTPGIGVIKDTVLPETAAPPTNAPVKSPEPKVTIVKPVENQCPALRWFSLFDFSNILFIEPSLNYFYYNEHVELNDFIASFLQEYSRQPAIIGMPKSSEYGTVLGVNVGEFLHSRYTRLFARLHAGILFGIGNTYDGSSQVQPIDSAGTVIGLEFIPHTDNKDNYFLSAGVDAGYTFPDEKYPLAVYSGINFRYWYRDMIMYEAKRYLPSDVSQWESYYWFSIPLGVLVTKPVSPRWVIGAEPHIDLMFFGQMKLNYTYGSQQLIDCPAVTLGNRASYTLELFSQERINKETSLKFSTYVMLYGFGKSNVATALIASDTGAVKTSFWEPASGSVWIGFNVQIGFLSTGHFRNPDNVLSGSITSP